MKEFQTHNDDAQLSAGGTCKKGEIQMGYSNMVKAFGEPERYESGKVGARWVILFEDGTIATVYNYKYRTPEETTNWHIGGIDNKALYRVAEVLEEMLFGKNSRKKRRMY